jgi:peptide/nickel transport system permease protein
MRLLTRNRMALVGLIILVGFVFAAVAAPILTPYSPTAAQQSGALAQPEWVMAFPDGYYLSKNMVVVDDPSFGSQAAVQAWTITATPSVMSNLQLSYAPGIATPGSKGSMQLIYTGAGPANVTVSRTFHYPYHGPPTKFIGNIALRPSGVDSSQPMGMRVFIDRLGDQTFSIWQINDTVGYTQLPSTGGWLHPSYALDSVSSGVQSSIGATDAQFSPAQIIFSAVQDYSYGVQLTFYGKQQVNIDDLSLNLYGSAWGLLGTDYNGTDLMAQVLYGARISLFVGFLATVIGIGLGLVVGLVAGFLGSIVDQTLMRFTDMMLVIPVLPLLLVLVAVLGSNILNIIIIIGFLGWMGFARIIRSQVLSLRERPFIEAAKAAGAGNGRIMVTHIFPNIVSLTYVNLALTVPAAILTEAALEFLGLGDPTVVSWGIMFYHAEISGSLFKWFWVMPPGLSIALISLSFILIGYALDEIFNPKLRKRR